MTAPQRDFLGSITYRLSLYFALVSLALMSSVGTYLYSALERRLTDEHKLFLANDIEVIRSRLAEVANGVPLTEDPMWKHVTTPIGSRLHIAIFDDRQNILVPAAALNLPFSVLPQPAESGTRAVNSILWQLPSGMTYQLVAAWAGVGPAQSPKVLLALALDVSMERRLLAGYRSTMFVTLIVALLCSAILGYVAARQGLSPVRKITRAANDITSTRLHKKLALEDTPAELRELVVAFNGMLDRLEASFSRLSQFSSDLAHELRTPINNLLGEAQVALTKARTAEEYRGVVESSVEELERLSRMIGSMLFLANADHAETVITALWLDARRELEKIAEFYQVVADETGAQIRCMGDAKVFADPMLFRRATGNLLSNALRHSSPGGEIRMTVTGETNGGVTVAVRNSGPGIPAEHLSKIFDRFYRVEPSRGKVLEGAGLGLAIVKTIMHAHGGEVTVESTPEVSTVFTLQFPAGSTERSG